MRFMEKENNDMLAPVIVFAYNREKHLDKTLESLCKNRLAADTELFIFIDGPKKVEDYEKNEAVYRIAQKYLNSNCFRNVSIEKSDSNRGLAASIIGGVTKIIGVYKKVIVLEDDLLTAPDFLEYMNQGLDYYQREKRVGAISGFEPAVRKKANCINGIYKARTGNSCGWGTWFEIWNEVDWEVKDYNEFENDEQRQRAFDAVQYGISDILKKQQNGEINSWAVRWDYHFFKNSLWTIYPDSSRITNIGFDGLGSTSNNRMDRRGNVVCKESEFKMEPFDMLVDWTKWTADSFRPTMLEKLYDFVFKR